MDYEKLLRDSLIPNVRAGIIHIHMHIYNTGKADKKSWLR